MDDTLTTWPHDEANTCLEFFAPGIPRPQGSKRHVGGGRMIEQSPHLENWRAVVALAARIAIQKQGWAHYDAPAFALLAAFTFPATKNKRDCYHNTRPDLDKALRSVFDALTGIVWLDDSRVASVVAYKRHGVEPGVFLSINPAPESR